jgi:DinB superfamily
VGMTAEERDFALGQLAESRDGWLRLFHGFSAVQLDYSPGADRWSVSRNLEHVTIVEKRSLPLIETALKQTPDPSRRSGYPGSHEGLVKLLRDRSHPRRGPSALQPSGRWKQEELIAEFEAARKRTYEMLESTTADLHAHFSPHLLFGELDCYQWFLFLAAHSDRHRLQAEEVIASEGFPRAAAV